MHTIRPSRQESSLSSMVVINAVVTQVDIDAARRSGQIRRKILFRFPPVMACQILVMKQGSNIRAIASRNPRVNESNARTMVGKPRPINPFIVPAKRKTATRMKNVSTAQLSIGLFFHIILLRQGISFWFRQ